MAALLITEDDWKRIVRTYRIEPLSDEGFIAAGIYLTIVGIVATVGNSIVIATFLRDKTLLRKPQNLLLLNLAVSDIGISLFGYPWTTASCFARQYLFGEIFCALQGFLCFTFAQTDMNTLACLSVYRYITICYPEYAHNLNLEVTKWTVVLTWLYTLIWTCMPLFGWSSYTFEPFGTSCSIDWTNPSSKALSYTWSLILFCFLLHVVVMIFSYYKIVIKIREVDGRSPLATITNPRTGAITRAVNIKREKKVTVTAFFLNATFIIIWLPYCVVCVWSVYQDLPPWTTTFPTFFAKSSCMMNPFLYFLTNSNLRQKAKRLFLGHPRRVHPFPPMPTQPQSEINKEGIYTGRVTVNVEHMDARVM